MEHSRLAKASVENIIINYFAFLTSRSMKSVPNVSNSVFFCHLKAKDGPHLRIE